MCLIHLWWQPGYEDRRTGGTGAKTTEGRTTTNSHNRQKRHISKPKWLRSAERKVKMATSRLPPRNQNSWYLVNSNSVTSSYVGLDVQRTPSSSTFSLLTQISWPRTPFECSSLFLDQHRCSVDSYVPGSTITWPRWPVSCWSRFVAPIAVEIHWHWPNAEESTIVHLPRLAPSFEATWRGLSSPCES